MNFDYPDNQPKLRLPNIYACLNSQHSLRRLEASYPTFKQEYLSLFYSNYFNSGEKLKTEFMNTTGLDNINLKELFSETAPELVVLRVSSRNRKRIYRNSIQCRVNGGKCPQPVKKLTQFGYCYHWDLKDTDNVTVTGEKSGFIFYGAYNQSDATIG